ncbi:MAG: TM0996/MTH895 family glutaredoxin-like protein [Thermoguttaceae bacterium]|nr:TM0996/MTH895 family glutaredoxin-like protein [Thermoguttaceae bacterium]MBQ6618767.1 TM0996/MTH895 family glutaredoxin-like protein [Thermoguttaceae bacterium]
MVSFRFSRNKGEKKAPDRSGDFVKSEKGEITNDRRSEAGDVIRRVQVLGAGCKSCRQMFENARLAVKESGLSVEVEYITDMKQIMTYGVMSLPALVINEKVVSMGKILNVPSIKRLLS